MKEFVYYLPFCARIISLYINVFDSIHNVNFLKLICVQIESDKGLIAL